MSPSRFLPVRAAASLLLSASLTACVPAPDLGIRPEMRAPAGIAAGRSLAAGNQADWPGDGWWNAYGDTQLNQLIAEGLAGSPDAAAAAARFRKAQGLAQQAGASLLPSIDAKGKASLDKQSYSLGFPKQFIPQGWQDVGQTSLNLSFDLDLWGRNRAALAAATSQAEAARIDQYQARLMLTTGIASAYADLARLYAEHDVLSSAIDLRLATQKLVSDRVLNGLDTRAELKQADAGVPQARADLAEIDEMIALNRNQIAALLGAGPDRGLTLVRPAQPALTHRSRSDDDSAEYKEDEDSFGQL